jgi:hypothetical protein
MGFGPDGKGLQGLGEQRFNRSVVVSVSDVEVEPVWFIVDGGRRDGESQGIYFKLMLSYTDGGKGTIKLNQFDVCLSTLSRVQSRIRWRLNLIIQLACCRVFRFCE